MLKKDLKGLVDFALLMTLASGLSLTGLMSPAHADGSGIYLTLPWGTYYPPGGQTINVQFSSSSPYYALGPAGSGQFQGTPGLLIPVTGNYFYYCAPNLQVDYGAIVGSPSQTCGDSTPPGTPCSFTYNVFVPLPGTDVTEFQYAANFGFQCDADSVSVQINLVSGFDLSISSPLISQSGAAIGADGNLQVSPGFPIAVTVPISGSGFENPETRSTSVTLQSGTQQFSQSVNLADIQSGAVSSLTFNVTFDPSLAGTTQAITATIAPNNPFNETNFANNYATAQVDVVGYKLIAFLDGSSTPIADSGGEKTLVPSRKACGALSETEDGDTDVEIRCVKRGDPTYAPVPGCKFLLDLSQGPDLGGHNHNLGDESRPFVLDPTSPSFPVGQFLSVDTAGNDLTYTPPEVAGDVFFEVTGTDPSGNQISGPSFMFHIKDTILGQMVSLNGIGADLGPTGNNPGISVVADSHPGDGVFGTEAMQAAVAQLVQNYYKNAELAGVSNPPPVLSQAATMQEGGLFDANWNGAINPALPTPWAPPHCGHRNGVTIDLSLSQFIGPQASQEKNWLKLAARKAHFQFTNPQESPKNQSANHWHAVLGAFQ